MTSIRKIDDTTWWLYAWTNGDIKVRSVHSSLRATRNAAARWRRSHAAQREAER